MLKQSTQVTVRYNMAGAQVWRDGEIRPADSICWSIKRSCTPEVGLHLLRRWLIKATTGSPRIRRRARPRHVTKLPQRILSHPRTELPAIGPPTHTTEIRDRPGIPCTTCALFPGQPVLAADNIHLSEVRIGSSTNLSVIFVWLVTSLCNVTNQTIPHWVRPGIACRRRPSARAGRHREPSRPSAVHRGLAAVMRHVDDTFSTCKSRAGLLRSPRHPRHRSRPAVGTGDLECVNSD